VQRVVSWFMSAERKCRIGKVIAEMGLEEFRKAVL
jgi:dissimilatory sulfite reductase (desulfoviridin) alpha/beta subunit